MSQKENAQLLICLEELKKAFNELAERIKSLENEINQGPQTQGAPEGGNSPSDPPALP